MYVNGLNGAHERDEKNASQRQHSEQSTPTHGVFNGYQAERPSNLVDHNCPLKGNVTNGWTVRCGLSVTRLPAYSPNSSRRRLVWARLTGISVCFLSSRRNW